MSPLFPSLYLRLSPLNTETQRMNLICVSKWDYCEYSTIYGFCINGLKIINICCLTVHCAVCSTPRSECIVRRTEYLRKSLRLFTIKRMKKKEEFRLLCYYRTTYRLDEWMILVANVHNTQCRCSQSLAHTQNHWLNLLPQTDDRKKNRFN